MVLAMDLRIEVVESPHRIAVTKQQRRAVGGDKAGAAGDQDGLGHSCSESAKATSANTMICQRFKRFG